MFAQHPTCAVRNSSESLFEVPAPTSARETLRRRFALGIRVALAAAALLLLAIPQVRGDTTWSVPSGDWSLAPNWGGTLPGDNDDVYVINGGTVAVTVSGAVCQDIYLGDPNSAYSGTVQMSGGNLTTFNNDYVGNLGAGTFIQSGGTNSIGTNLNLGYGTGASGSYNLSGSGVLSAVNENVGYSSNGTFSQSGGTNALSGNLYLGWNVGTSGSYSLSAGSLSAYDENVGNSGTGAFIQSGGTNALTDNLYLGAGTGSIGSYSLGGGVFSAASVYVGSSGTGTFVQTGGANNLGSGTLGLGAAMGSSGSYSLGGGLLFAANQYVGSSGTGTFIQTGGTNNLAGGSLYLGQNLGSSGSYSLSGSGLLAGGTEYVGYFGPGTFLQSGGTNNLGGGSLFLGYNAGNPGTYTLSGSGVLSVSGTESVGAAGNGTFNQTGGSNSVNYLAIGSLGLYNLSGGTLQVSGGGLANQGIFNGGQAGLLTAANAIVDFSAGTLQNTSSMSLTLGPGSLLIVPAGFNTSTAFRNFSGALGLTHTVGTTLTVTATQGFSGIGSIADHVNCQGTISAAAGGSINLNGGITVSGSGNVSLGNGSFTVNDVALSGVSSGSLSAYNGYVGNFGTGTFSQSGGVTTLGSTSSGGLYLGYNAGDAGTYTLSNSGSLSAYDEVVGNSGAGTFSHSGGTNTLSDNLYLGQYAGSSGSYSLSSPGLLSVTGTETVGNFGSGTFTQTGGTHNVVSNLYLGNNPGSIGSYNLSGSSVLSAAAAYVGNSGSGTFTQSGGTSVLANGLYLANNPGSSGTYNLRSGSLSAAGEYVGNSANGAFIQSGGTNNLGGGSLYLAFGTACSGSYSLGPGSLSAYDEFVGYSGSGSFTQSSGTNTLSDNLYLGQNAGSIGSYSLSGSSVLSAASEYVGSAGTGTFNQSGGTNTLSGLFSLGGGGTYNLAAGALVVGGAGMQGTGTFNLSGGTLVASAGFSSSQAMTLPVSGGNGNINTNGNAILLFAGLSGPGGLNVTGTGSVTLMTSNTYTAGTTITGGTLQIDSGGATGSLLGNITNNGTLVFDRSDNPTFGGAISGVGSLAQAGTGVLTLAGSNTFMGGTTILAGSISLNNANALLNSTVTVNNNNTLLFNSNSGAITTFNVGGLAGAGNLSLSDGSRAVTLNVGGNGASTTYLGTLSGSGGLTKTGSGILDLAGSSTYTGSTTIAAGGGLQLDFTQLTSPVNNIVNSASNSSSLVLSGGMLLIQGSLSTADSQQFNNTAVKAGASAIVLTANSSNNLLLSMGSISRSVGGTVDFTLSGTTQGAGNGLTTTSSNTNGILGGYATVSEANWATVTGGYITVYSGYVLNNLGTGGPTTSGTTNFETFAAQTAVTTAKVVNTLNLTNPYGVTMTGSGALTLAGGGLIGSTTGTVTGGSLQGSSGTAGDLIVITPLTLTIGSMIIDNSGHTALTKAGSAALILTGSNTYTGVTTIGAGTLQVGTGGAGASIISTSGVLNNGSLIFSHSDTETFAAPISGIGSLMQTGTSSLTLLGSSTYTGGTTISSGTLQLGGGGGGASIGSTSGVLDYGSLVFSHSDTVTFSPPISGSGSLTQTGTGPSSLTLLGNNTYSGSTTVSVGTLQVGNGGSGEFLGSPSIALSNSALLVFNHSDPLTYSGVISGTGSLTQTGTGQSILTLLGSNTYSGSTTISAGTLQLGNGRGSGAIAGNVLDNGTLVVSRSDNVLILTGVISGSGGVSQIGTGAMFLYGSNTYTGPTTILAGTLRVGLTAGGGASIGSTSGVLDNGTLNFSHSDAVTFAPPIIGSGNLIQSGSGILTLVGNDTYSGSTSVSGGTLQVGNGGSGELFTSSSVAVSSNAWLVFNHADALTYNGPISGAGNLTQTGTGLLTLLSNSNTYTGQTTISGGTLQAGNGGPSGSVGGNVLDNALLVFNLSGVATYAGTVTGSGAFTQMGPGLLILTGSNGNSGLTTISGGTLEVGDGAGITGNVLNNAVLAVNNDFTGVTFSGNISGSGGLMQMGPGASVLAASNTYSGGTTIAAGSITLNDPNAAQNSTVTVGVNNGLLFNTNSGVLTTFNVGGLAGSGNISLADGSFPVALSAGGNGASTTYSGSLSGSGSLIKVGSGILVLSGSNVYSGGTTLAGGELSISAGSNLGPAGSTVAFNGGTLQVTGTALTGIGAYSVNWSTFNGGFDIANAADVFTVSNAISGSGSLSMLGAGTLLLTASNGYSGGTTISGGTLQIDSGGATGSIMGNVLDNASLALARSDTVTFSGTINGSGNLIQLGPGTLILTGSNAFTGTTTVSAGTLEVGNGGSGASIGGTSGVVNNGSLVFNHSDAVTFSPAIIGSGSLRQTGTSILTLLGGNTYTGATTVNAGTLQVGNGGGGASIGNTSGVVDNGSLVFNHSDAVAFSPAVSGSGSLTQTGNGVLTLLGSNTYSGGTSILAGALQVGNGITAGSITGNVFDNGSLIANSPGNFTINGSISGSGGLTQAGAGILTVLGSNTYTGATMVSAGTLQVGNGGSGASLGGGGSSVVDNGSLVFNHIDAVMFSPAISGSGSLVQTGNGLLTLLGSNTFSGGTTILAGTLQVGNGGATGYLAGSVAVGTVGTLVLDRSDNVSISNALTGAGALVKMGGDTATLSGSMTGFTGPITVVQGQLVLTTPAAPAATLYTPNSGATLVFQGAAFPMNFSTISAPSGGTVQYSSATITNAFLSGTSLGVSTGVQVLSASTTNTFNDVTIDNGAVVQQNGPAVFTNVTNYGQITGSGGLTWSGVANAVGGALTLGGTSNFSNWSNAGTITILSGGLLNNRNSNLMSGGGQITINSGGTLNADSAAQGAVLDIYGCLLVNNGTVLGTTYVGYGATLSGSGANGPVVVSNLTSPGSIAGTIAVAPGSSPQSPNVIINNGTIAGNGVFAAPTTIASTAIISSSASLTLTNNLSGPGQVVLTGPGEVTLTGSDTYTGSTTISGGTLQVGNGGSGASLGDTSGVFDNGLLAFNNSDVMTFSSSIGGGGSLLKTGPGTLILSGSNDYEGRTTVNAGTLCLTDADALPSGGNLTVAAGATFVFDPSLAGGSVSVSQTYADSSGAAVAAVPEPGSLALLAAALGCAAWTACLHGRRRSPRPKADAV